MWLALLSLNVHDQNDNSNLFLKIASVSSVLFSSCSRMHVVIFCADLILSPSSFFFVSENVSEKATEKDCVYVFDDVWSV